MVRWIGVGVAAVCVSAAAPGDVGEIIQQHSQAMTFEDGALGGAGAELLLEEAAGASFLLLGESHLNEETPALVRAMLPALEESGYAALAIETGERIAAHAEREIESGRVDRLARLFAEIPFTAAFIDRVGELALLESAVTDHGMELWGLDQVFMGGARFNLAELVRLAPDDEARAIAQAQLDRANAGFVEFAQTGDASHGYLNSAGSEEYDTLREALAGVDEGLRIIDELETSGEIYRLFRSGENYASNKKRIDLMRRHLAEHVRALENGERVVIKVGSNHARRGYTPLNQLDIGAVADGMGELRGGGSLHVFVTSAGFADRSRAVAALAPALGDGDWVVVDLRALRPHFHREWNREGFEELNNLVLGFDLAVVARSFTPAEQSPGVPAPPAG